MGPDIKRVQPKSQATPFAEDFMKVLEGYISTAFSNNGPMQRESGSSPRQYLQSVMGINTAGDLRNDSDRVIGGIQKGHNMRVDRGASQIREQFGGAGHRISSSLAAKEGQFRNEAGINLEELIGQVLLNQSAQEQAARQFDVQANISAFAPLFQMASLGIMPEEIIATPGVGSQILTGITGGLSNYLLSGGRFGMEPQTQVPQFPTVNIPGQGPIVIPPPRIHPTF